MDCPLQLALFDMAMVPSHAINEQGTEPTSKARGNTFLLYMLKLLYCLRVTCVLNMSNDNDLPQKMSQQNV